MSSKSMTDALGVSNLTKGLNRILVAIILLVAAICAVTFYGFSRLSFQTERWSHIEAIDDAREALIIAVRAYVDLANPDSAATILVAFDTLTDLVTRRLPYSANDDLMTNAAKTAVRTRALFNEARQKQSEVSAQNARLQAGVSRLLELSASWAAALQDESLRTNAQAEAIEEEQRQLSDTQRTLIDAMVAMGRVQRQLEAASRLNRNAPGVIAAAATAALGAAELPKPCLPNEIEHPGRLCSPNSARVHVAIAALGEATDETIDRAINGASLALEAYIRAGEIRFKTLSEALTQAIDRSQTERAHLEEISLQKNGLTRVNRAFLQVETTLKAAQKGGASLREAEQTMAFLISQMRYRAVGLVRQSQVISADADEVAAISAEYDAEWPEMRHGIARRDQLLADFDREMAALGNTISTTADRVRGSTQLWVHLFATASIGAAALLGVAAVAAIWLIQKHIVVPLSQVTRTIHSLAQGKFDQSITVTQRTFGFDRLGRALERLCRAMSERNALADRNAKQKALIERNMHELEQTNEQMQWLALHDPLTELGNRRNADQRLAELTENGKATSADFCLIHLDVDRFKEVNDTLGHEAGDFVLKHVAQLLRSQIGDGGDCYRIGGDEFLIALDANIDKATVTNLAEIIVADMARPIDYMQHVIRVGASLGIAYGRYADFDASTALVNADLALYETKRCGRNDYRFFAAELQSLSRQRKALSDDLMTAIEAEDFIPFYQPQFYADGLQLRGVETLCRWHIPGRGWIPPGQFLGVAEELKLVGKIDHILFHKVADDVARMRALGLAVPRMSFNLTADRLTTANLADDLANTFGSEVTVAVELLESMSLDSLSESVRWSIDSLKEKGIEVEIDDFGSCRASIAGLIAVGPNSMKIDSSLVLPLTHSTQHFQLVKAIVEIGLALGIEVVGEGVETPEHVQILTDLGCDVLQGFALARPMPLDALMELLRANQPITPRGEDLGADPERRALGGWSA